MSVIDHLSVDLADPYDIRLKLPQARKLFATKQQELVDLSKQVDHWEKLINVLAALVGEPGVERPEPTHNRGLQVGAKVRKKRAPSQEKAIEALRQFGRPTGPSALYRFMVAEQLDAPANPNALGASLYGAAKTGRIKKTPDGLYAALDWEPQQDRLTTENGEGQPLSPAAHPQEAANE